MPLSHAISSALIHRSPAAESAVHASLSSPAAFEKMGDRKSALELIKKVMDDAHLAFVDIGLTQQRLLDIEVKSHLNFRRKAMLECSKRLSPLLLNLQPAFELIGKKDLSHCHHGLEDEVKVLEQEVALFQRVIGEEIKQVMLNANEKREFKHGLVVCAIYNLSTIWPDESEAQEHDLGNIEALYYFVRISSRLNSACKVYRSALRFLQEVQPIKNI